MNMEYDMLQLHLNQLIQRNRGFDLEFARCLVSLLRSHNTFMELALKGDREAETNVAEGLDGLRKLSGVTGGFEK